MNNDESFIRVVAGVLLLLILVAVQFHDCGSNSVLVNQCHARHGEYVELENGAMRCIPRGARQ